ncbi:hypothetical protein D9M69_687110 [compost metagenome]
MAAGAVLLRRHRGFGAGPLRQQHAALVEKARALLGERQPPGGAVDELRAQAAFQRVDAPAQHHRCDARVQRGGGQAAVLHRQHEGLDFLEAVHGAMLTPVGVHCIPGVSNQSTGAGILKRAASP